MPPKPKVHGEKGAFVGGDWVDIEDCGEEFSIKNGSCGGDCSACPRSRTKTMAAKDDGTYDVVIIGAGCIGSAVARELAKTTASVLLLEAADDVTQGATKGNSGIVHAGYDDKPGSVRAKYCWAGNQMFPELDKELHFGFEKNGSLVVGKGEEDRAHLEELLERGHTNGVANLRIIEKAELHAKEPFIHPDATAALYSPDAGTLIPYEYAIALAENAADNGVEIRIRREVSAIEKPAADGLFTITANHWEPKAYVASTSTNYTAVAVGGAVGSVVFASAVAMLPNLGTPPMLGLLALASAAAGALGGAMLAGLGAGSGAPVGRGGRAVTVEEMAVGGSGSRSAVDGVTVATETIKARYIINAGGCGSDKISKLIGDNSFYIKPRLGEYILLHKDEGHKAQHTLFPTPDPVYGKGVLVQKTLWGNLILGPTARDTFNKEQMAMTKDEIMEFILGRCKHLVPSIDASTAIHAFSGARAKNSTGDWVIRPSEECAQFIHAAGIDSPGLAGSPAIALAVVKMLREAGLKLVKDPNFNPNRAPIITPKQGWKGLKACAEGKEPPAPGQHIVCKCEKVTEEEIVRAMHRSLPLDSTQALRKRTRAGMGHCQGSADNYNCEARVAQIIARETKARVAGVGRRPWPATSLLPQRWPTAAEKAHLTALSQA